MRVREVVSVAPGELMIALSKPAFLPVEAYENGQDPFGQVLDPKGQSI